MKITENRVKFVASNKIEWQLQNIPNELKQLNTWKLCYLLHSQDPFTGEVIQTPKRPIGGVKQDNSFTFVEILKHLEHNKDRRKIDPAIDVQHIGLRLTPSDPYIAIDIDHTDPHKLPETIQRLLVAHPTYTEESPSGQGAHLWYKVSAEDKQTLCETRKAYDNGIYIYNCFLTVTGFKLGQSTDIATISIDDLPGPKTPLRLVDKNEPLALDAGITYHQLKQRLFLIPPSLTGHPARYRFETIYKTFEPPIESPSDYDHWRIIAAAWHDGCWRTGHVTEGSVVFDEWSATDTINYAGQPACIQKYFDNTPAETKADISYKTLLRLAQAAIPEWPYPYVDRQGKRHMFTPEPNNIMNFKTYVEFLNLSLKQNDIDYEISLVGNDVIQKRYFNTKDLEGTALKAGITMLCHDTYFAKSSLSSIKAFAEWFGIYNVTKYNPIRDWIAKQPVYDPKTEPNYLDQMFNTLHINPQYEHMAHLYKAYFTKALMGIIRAHFYTGHYQATTGMVILQGPEQTYKSTWVRQLLPFEFRKYVLSSQMMNLKGSSNLKEVQLECGQCQIWVKDEVENLLSSGDAALKNLLVQEYDNYRPLFSNRIAATPRKCIFFGTTNRTTLPITDDGSRRIQVIPVDLCDTTSQSKIPMDRFYAQFKWIFDNQPADLRHNLWTLTDTELVQTNAHNAEFRALQDADYELLELYDFDRPFSLEDFNWRWARNTKADKLPPDPCRISDIIDYIQAVTGKRPAYGQMRHALRRVCGQWTNSANRSIAVDKGFTLESGQIKYKPATRSYAGKSGWLLPPPRSKQADEELL